MPKGESNNVAMSTLPSSSICTTQQNKFQRWMFDSGCTRRIANVERLFSIFVTAERSVQAGNNETKRSYGYKTVKVVSFAKVTDFLITLHDVIFAPGIISNLSLLRVLAKPFSCSHWW